MNKRYGWFSAKAADMSGYHVYTSPNGNHVMVTCTSLNPNLDPHYKWDDTIFIGEVCSLIQTFDSLPCEKILRKERFNEVMNFDLPLKIGDKCAKCKHEVKERELFTGKFIGCMC